MLSSSSADSNAGSQIALGRRFCLLGSDASASPPARPGFRLDTQTSLACNLFEAGEFGLSLLKRKQDRCPARPPPVAPRRTAPAHFRRPLPADPPTSGGFPMRPRAFIP